MADPESVEREQLRAGFEAVERRIDAACMQAGRARTEVSLLPVTKTVPAARIADAIALGYREFGENRVQEAAAKAAALADHELRWHLIGPLQGNKVKQALGCAACVHTLDRVRIVERLGERLAQTGDRLEVLLQVNTSRAPQQAGVSPEAAEALAAAVVARSELHWTGLMTIGRLSEDPADTRDCFRTLRQLRDRLQDHFGQALPVLSMGMSHDLEVAIAEGATCVRIGSAIFGVRPAPAAGQVTQSKE